MQSSLELPKDKTMDRQATSTRKFRFNLNSCLNMFAMALVAVFALTLLTPHALQAQTFSVIHNFSGEGDGTNPYAGVTIGGGGVLYGTASGGGTHGHGVVFRLSHIGSGWVFGALYEFTGGSDGATPYGGIAIGPNGALYGTPYGGGVGDGTAFELRPPATYCSAILCYWNETVLHTFTGVPDGEYPFENLTFDQAGNIYGTTNAGGRYSTGSAFELSPSGGGWTESILHNFGSGNDGSGPVAGVLLDTAGNVYGTTPTGGTGTLCSGGCGTVYQLMPSDGGWVENVLVNFDQANGYYPSSNLILDDSGNLYGTTLGGGQNGNGVVFELAPSGGGWTYSQLYSFASCNSHAGVARDTAGNLYGVCYVGGTYEDGWVYELTNCSESCTLVDLHDFQSRTDGANPVGSPVLDANGNLYGTTLDGGASGNGTVWEIAGVGARP